MASRKPPRKPPPRPPITTPSARQHLTPPTRKPATTASAATPRPPAKKPAAPAKKPPPAKPSPRAQPTAAARPDVALPSAAAENGKRVDQLIARIVELHNSGKADFYAIGQLMRELREPAMYTSVGAKSFSHLLRTRSVPRRAMAYRLIDIVEYLDAPTAHSLGVERAYHAIQWARHHSHGVAPKALIRRNPTIRYRGTAFELKTISTRLLADIATALRDGLSTDPPPGLHTATRRLSQRLRHAGIDAIRVTSHDRGPGSYINLRLTPAEANKLSALLR